MQAGINISQIAQCLFPAKLDHYIFRGESVKNKPDKFDVLVFITGVGFIILGVVKLQLFALQEDAYTRFVPVSAEVTSISAKAILKLNGNRSLWIPTIKYSYSVNMQSYTSNVYSFDQFYSLDEVDKIVDRYNPGDKITAYYDPKAPDTAVLYNNVSSVGKNKSYLAIILGFISAASRLMILFRR